MELARRAPRCRSRERGHVPGCLRDLDDADARARTTSPTSPTSNAAPTLPTDVTVAGVRSVNDVGGTRTVTLDMRSADGSVSVRIELNGSADASGGVVLDSGEVSVTIGGTARWNGPVTGLHSSTLTADLSGANGGRIALSADLSIDRAREIVTSTVHLDSSDGW